MVERKAAFPEAERNEGESDNGKETIETTAKSELEEQGNTPRKNATVSKAQKDAGGKGKLNKQPKTK